MAGAVTSANAWWGNSWGPGWGYGGPWYGGYPGWGGWGGRFKRIRDNTWLDPVPATGYQYPKGRWYSSTAWGRVSLRQGETSFNNPRVQAYFKPMWRWSEALQNDFAARADWSVKDYDEANHPPEVAVAHALGQEPLAGLRIVGAVEEGGGLEARVLLAGLRHQGAGVDLHLAARFLATAPFADQHVTTFTRPQARQQWRLARRDTDLAHLGGCEHHGHRAGEDLGLGADDVDMQGH